MSYHLLNTRRLNAMLRWIVEKIYHYSTYLTSWSWTWLYGKRKVVVPKGMLRMSKIRVNYYKSLISFNKHDNIVEQIIQDKIKYGTRRRQKNSEDFKKSE